MRQLPRVAFLSNALKSEDCTFIPRSFYSLLMRIMRCLPRSFFLGAFHIAVGTCCDLVYTAAAGRLYEPLQKHSVAERIQC